VGAATGGYIPDPGSSPLLILPLPSSLLEPWISEWEEFLIRDEASVPRKLADPPKVTAVFAYFLLAVSFS